MCTLPPKCPPPRPPPLLRHLSGGMDAEALGLLTTSCGLLLCNGMMEYGGAIVMRRDAASLSRLLAEPAAARALPTLVGKGGGAHTGGQGVGCSHWWARGGLLTQGGGPGGGAG